MTKYNNKNIDWIFNLKSKTPLFGLVLGYVRFGATEQRGNGATELGQDRLGLS
jgi:hypothetical protein